jgi:hypothetical protein
MRSALRVLLLWTAGLLLFAHSVVPHSHGTERPSNSGISNWVTDPASGEPLPIEADLGSDHLEHFRLDEEDNTSRDAYWVFTTLPAAVPSPSVPFLNVEAAEAGLFPPVPALRALVPADGAGIRPPPALS